MAIKGVTKSKFAKGKRSVHKAGRKMHSSPKASKRPSRGSTRY